MTTLQAVPDAALDQLFRNARTVHAFRPVPVTDQTGTFPRGPRLPFDDVAQIL